MKIHQIDNSKIEGIDVRWNTFRGFTVLLHNPAEVSADGDFARVWGDVYNDPRLTFYAALARACERLQIEEQFFRYSLCLVPPPTFHCTLADGVHPLNIDQFGRDVRPALQRFADGLPDSLHTGLPEVIPAGTYDDPGGGKIRFRFRKLSLPDDGALLARLEPADNESRERHEQLLGERKGMDNALVALGKDPLGPWNAHITLGYGAVKSLAAELRPSLPEWEAVIREETGSHVIEYSTYHLAGFVDMTTFYIRRSK